MSKDYINKTYNGHLLSRNPYKDWEHFSTTGVVGFPNNYIDKLYNSTGEFTKSPVIGVDTNLNVVTSLYIPHDVNWNSNNGLSSVSNMIKTFGYPYLINGEPQTSSFKTNYFKVGAKSYSYAQVSSNNETNTATFNTLGAAGDEREYPTYGLFSLNDSRFTYNIKTFVSIKSSATVSSQIPLDLSTSLGVWMDIGNAHWIASREGFNISVVDKGNNIYELYKDSTVGLAVGPTYWIDKTPTRGSFYVRDEFLSQAKPNSANSGLVFMDYNFISGTWSSEGYYKLQT